MRTWWQRRSLKLRLSVWFTAVASGILLGLTPVVYGLIEHRLHIEFDRQLRIDWDLALAHLEADGEGNIRWHSESGEIFEGASEAAMWFEAWSREGQVLLGHWPPETIMQQPLTPPRAEKEPFHTYELPTGTDVRTMEQEARVGGRSIILRVFRDESGLHRTLREILIGFGLGIPVAALLSALGGYVMAGRMLTPISHMAERARQITSESLSERLPNPNPHDELGQMATVFNETLQRLQGSFDALQRFTADASHELRTPLTALRSVGEVGLREAANAESLRETIGSMLEEAQHLNDLIDSLLLLARVENAPAPKRREALRLDEVGSEARERLGVLAAERGQSIDLTMNTEAVASGDWQLTRQAVMNILHNAIRYSPAGAKVSIRSFCRDARAGIEITDQGPGIAPKFQEKIFERFFRVDKSRSRQDGGAGLGLAIAKLFVEQQGGSIELDSTPGKGSSFRILLPRQNRIE